MALDVLGVDELGVGEGLLFVLLVYCVHCCGLLTWGSDVDVEVNFVELDVVKLIGLRRLRNLFFDCILALQWCPCELSTDIRWVLVGICLI